MKTYLAYGFVWALAGALLTLALFFLGLHSQAEKLQSAQIIATIGGLIISITTIMLGTRARRAEVPATAPFGYAQALGAGVMITLFAAAFGMISSVVYMQFINPGMADLLVQAQVEKWESAGMGSTQIEAAEAMMRRMMHPVFQAVFAFLGAMFSGVIISLLTSIFLKRAPTTEPPVAA